MKVIKILITFGLILIILLNIFRTDTHKNYNMTWKIDIPNPNKTKRIIDSGHIDPTILDILYYDSNDSKVIKDKDYMKKIDIVELNEIFDNILEEKFIAFLNEEDKNTLKKLNINKLINENNYYTFIEEKQDFILLILDVEENVIYSFRSYSWI